MYIILFIYEIKHMKKYSMKHFLLLNENRR